MDLPISLVLSVLLHEIGSSVFRGMYTCKIAFFFFYLEIDPFHHCETYLFISGTLFFVLMSALYDIDIVTLAFLDL